MWSVYNLAWAYEIITLHDDGCDLGSVSATGAADCRHNPLTAAGGGNKNQHYTVLA